MAFPHGEGRTQTHRVHVRTRPERQLLHSPAVSSIGTSASFLSCFDYDMCVLSAANFQAHTAAEVFPGVEADYFISRFTTVIADEVLDWLH